MTAPAYEIPLSLISDAYDRKEKIKVREKVYELCPEPKWERFVERFMRFHKSRPKKYMITKNAIRMVEKIRSVSKVKCFPLTERTYVGHWQKSEGAWLWVFETIDGIPLGSQWQMAFLLRKEVNIEVSYSSAACGYDVDPDKPSLEIYRDAYSDPRHPHFKSMK